jgi:hypothetical protein
MPWPKKKVELRSICEKTNFADTCQYDSDKIPGPGTYTIRTHLSGPKVDKKWVPNSPIQPIDPMAAENGNYTPCPCDYSTFMGISLHLNSKQQIISKSPQINRSSSK